MEYRRSAPVDITRLGAAFRGRCILSMTAHGHAVQMKWSPGAIHGQDARATMPFQLDLPQRVRVARGHFDARPAAPMSR